MKDRHTDREDFFRNVAEGFAQMVFPENIYCMGCDDFLDGNNPWGLCETCMEQLFSLENLRRTTVEDCGEFSFSKVISCTIYGGRSREILSQLKNGGRAWYSRNLGRLMAERYREELIHGEDMSDRETVRGAELVTAVPMHPRKRQVRGYDQAQLLAEQVGRSLGIPCRECLCRLRETAPMKNMSMAQRRHNVDSAFGWAEGMELRPGSHVLLVDDIVTTGSTADACARLLLHHGAGDVTLLTFASAGHQLKL